MNFLFCGAVMSRFFTLLISFGLSIFLFCPAGVAQQYSSEQIASYVSKTPRKAENNIAPLVRYLTQPFSDDYDKAKAIAFWIANRISYDEYLYDSDGGGSTYLFNSYKPQSTSDLLRSRAGICMDFANLFQAMCRKAGITTRIVRGYVYPAGKAFSASIRKNYGHAWNYFYYKGKKIYVDTTFMAGGRLAADKYPNSSKRRRALYNLKKENKKQSKASPVYVYYFDFTYEDEESSRNQTRRER